MSDSERLLELIEEGVVGHGGDLGGWTRRADDTLQLFDGRVTLRANLEDGAPSGTLSVVHAHVFTAMHEYEDEVLDACLIGMGDDRKAALAQAAEIWIIGVAGPIKSFIDSQPVCMTCQAGVEGGDYGLAGLHAYVGPSLSRGVDDQSVRSAIDDTKPWFRFAAESAAPRRLHLAKACIVSKGKEGWYRILEVDGHDVFYRDLNWPTDVRGPEFSYSTRFAVFEFPLNSKEIRQRAELERTVRYFAENFSKHNSVDHLMERMVSQGFDPDLVHETESFSTIAFARTLFEEHGVQFSPTIIRARQDGRVQADVPLMSIPAYSRARALAVHLRETMPQDDFRSLCLYNAESNVILKAMNASLGELDLTKFIMFPCVVPDRGVSNETMDAAIAKLNELAGRYRATKRKPWWKFW